MKKSELLSYINNGAIDFYYGLMIETKLTFENLCDNIGKRIDESIEKYNNHIKISFQNDIEQAILKNGLEGEIRIKDVDKSKIMAQINETADLKDEICGIEFDVTDNGFKILPCTRVGNYLSFMNDESMYDFDFSKNYYGNVYVNSQNRFILPPIKVELENNTTTLLSAILFVFQNKAAVLRLTLPIDNVDSQPLKSNEIDNYIKSAKTLYGFPVQLKNKSIEDMQACYCQFLAGTNKVESVVCFKKIVNIILANHSYMVNNIKKIPNELKEDIYKISVAPVQERNGVSYVEEAKKHFDKNSFFFNGIGYVLSSMGKCVSIVDTSVLNFIKEKYDEKVVFNKIIGDLRRNIEFTITIILLKNINDSYTFEQKGLFNNKLSKVKNDYNRNKIFISILQNGVYGSVRELTDLFEKGMTFILDMKNTEDRMCALNNILEEEKSARTLQLQNVVSVVGLIFTIIFGLPSINETLSYIRNLCFFIERDIPFVSIENISFTIWCLTIIGLSFFTFYKSKTRKMD